MVRTTTSRIRSPRSWAKAARAWPKSASRPASCPTLAIVLAEAVEPAVGRRLHAGGPRLHVVLGVEVAAARVGGPDRRNRDEALVVPQRLQRREPRVQAEVPVQV